MKKTPTRVDEIKESILERGVQIEKDKADLRSQSQLPCELDHLADNKREERASKMEALDRLVEQERERTDETPELSADEKMDQALDFSQQTRDKLFRY